MIKEIAIQVSIKYCVIKDKTIQRFTVLGSKRNWKYLLEDRFHSKKIFENEIKKRALTTNNERYIFEKRIIKENIIELIFTNNLEGENNFYDYYFTVHDFVPTSFGCKFCSSMLEEINEESVQCDFFRKTVKRKKGSCKYFEQKRLFKT